MDSNYINKVKDLLSLSRINSQSSVNLDTELAQLAIKHGLAGWIFYREKNKVSGISNQLLAPLQPAFFQSTIHFQQKLKVFDTVQSLLKGASIPILALKGIALASSLYLDEGMRPMSDIDILVPDGMGIKALNVLLNAGAKALSVPRSKLHEEVHAHVRAIEVGGVMVEIHQRLFSLGSKYHTPEVDFFKDTVQIDKQGIIMDTMNPGLFFYHLVTHALKGTDMGMLRLAWLLDIALIIEQNSDSDQLISAIIDIKPERKKEIVELVHMSYFLLSDQSKVTQFTEKERTYLLHRIAEFMYNRDANKKHRNINMIENIQTPGVLNKIKLIWSEVFPSRNYMMFRYNGTENDSLLSLYKKRYFG